MNLPMSTVNISGPFDFLAKHMFLQHVHIGMLHLHASDCQTVQLMTFPPIVSFVEMWQFGSSNWMQA